jgi:hypothetical protein
MARKLAQPAPEFLHVIAAVKSSGLLMRELPLTGASPFGGLPDTALDQRQASAEPADPAARIDLLRRAAAARRHPESTQEKHDAKTAASPVFSFRRIQRSAVLAKSEARALPAAVNPIDAVDSGALAAETPAEFERRESEAAAPPPSMVFTPVPSPAAIPHPRNMAGAAIELLDALATELLAAPSTATDRSPLHPAAYAGGGAPTVNSRQDQTPDVSLRMAGHQPDVNPVQETLSLAPLSTAYNGPQAVHPVMRAGGAPSLPGLPQVSMESVIVSPPAASPNLDAETIASLVNEVLADQARRHGVDLS